ATDDRERYLGFWRDFGNVLKEGLAEDPGNRDRIARLLRFASTRGGDAQAVSLEEYVARMPSEQKHIYFITGESLFTARANPHLERLRPKGIEVLLLTDRIDEWLASHLTEFEGRE